MPFRWYFQVDGQSSDGDLGCLPYSVIRSASGLLFRELF